MENNEKGREMGGEKMDTYKVKLCLSIKCARL